MVYGVELFFVSARTIKRHHRLLSLSRSLSLSQQLLSLPLSLSLSLSRHGLSLSLSPSLFSARPFSLTRTPSRPNALAHSLALARVMTIKIDTHVTTWGAPDHYSNYYIPVQDIAWRATICNLKPETPHTNLFVVDGSSSILSLSPCRGHSREGRARR